MAKVALGEFTSAAQAVKVASIVAHVEEATGPKGHPLDMEALRGLAADPDVAKWLSTFPTVMLPVKR